MRPATTYSTVLTVEAEVLLFEHLYLSGKLSNASLGLSYPLSAIADAPLDASYLPLPGADATSQFLYPRVLAAQLRRHLLDTAVPLAYFPHSFHEILLSRCRENKNGPSPLLDGASWGIVDRHKAL
jgi:hypothetical protein